MTVPATSSRWTLPRRPGGWTLADAALAALFLGLLVTEILPNDEMTPRGQLATLSLLVAVPLAWRSALPATTAVLVCAGHLGTGLVATGPFGPQLVIVPVLVALYSAASRTRGRVAVVAGAVTLVLNVAAWVVTAEGHVDDFWPWMLWAGAWASGTFVRRRSDVAAHHAGRAALLEVEARTAAAESAQAERDRIARELHDVVAHSVSVMVVQAGAERLRLGADAGRTGQALSAIEETGRAALGELRTMLGVLRDGTGQELAPLPGLAALPALVERVRAAGLPVELDCDPASLPDVAGTAGAAAGLAAYRIVQEALTNVVRHAGMVPTRVHVDRRGALLRLEVVNGRPIPAPAPRAAGGRGTVGMRERATALGGSFEAGEHEGGYRVVAELPLRAGTVPA